MVDVCLLGCGGTKPLTNRGLTALYLDIEKHKILIDCGEGTQVNMQKYGKSLTRLDVICLTHYHIDHIIGLMGLLETMNTTERDEPITIIGAKGLNKILYNDIFQFYKLRFDVVLVELDDSIDKIDFGIFNIEPFKVDHTILCYGYKINIPQTKVVDIEKIKELNLTSEQVTMLKEGCFLESINGVLKLDDIVKNEKEQPKGISLVYCTDTRPNRNLQEKVKKVDLAILESMYFNDRNISDAKKSKHLVLSETLEIFKQSNIKNLWLTHYSPKVNSKDTIVHKQIAELSNVKLGYDGLQAQLSFNKEIKYRNQKIN